jgi:flagellar protein FliO/FliZ
MSARLLIGLALSLPLSAGAAAPETAVQDARKADAGTMPASVVPTAEVPAAGAPAAGAPAAGAPAPSPRAAPPDVVAPAPAARPAAPAPMATGSATGSLLQTMFALIVVLLLLAGLAWFLKRYGPKVSGGTANLRIVGALNLGGRERLLVVEVGDQWIVVGASPGRVNALATMPRQADPNALPLGGDGATLAPHQTPASNFADWLKQTIDKRK